MAQCYIAKQEGATQVGILSTLAPHKYPPLEQVAGLKLCIPRENVVLYETGQFPPVGSTAHVEKNYKISQCCCYAHQELANQIQLTCIHTTIKLSGPAQLQKVSMV